MTTVFAIGDHHINERSRFDECLAVHDRALKLILETPGKKVIVSTGDVYHAESTPRERLAAASFFQCAASAGPVVIVRGNHDRERDLDILGQLSAKHLITVASTPQIVTAYDLRIACLPWPDYGALLAATGKSGDEARQLASDGLRDVLRHLGTSQPNVLAAHAMVGGAVTSVGQPLIGHSMDLSLSDLALACAEINLLGHVHAPQEWRLGDVPTVYTGSPYRTTYGETEDKGIVVVNFDVNGAPPWRRHSLEARAMVLVDGPWRDVSALTSDQVSRGADVRIRYRFPEHERKEAREAARKAERIALDAGAADVQLSPVCEVTKVARSPEYARARTTREKLAAYWASKGIIEEKQARLLALLTEIGQ